MKNKKRAAIYVQYKYKDGSRTAAATASMGLLHWYGRITPKRPIENPKPFEIYVVGASMPSPYDPRFLALIVAGLERTFGEAPPIPQHLYEPAYYERFANDSDFRQVATELKQGSPAVVEYERVCLEILKWLEYRGDITGMVFDQPIQPLAS